MSDFKLFFTPNSMEIWFCLSKNVFLSIKLGWVGWWSILDYESWFAWVPLKILWDPQFPHARFWGQKSIDLEFYTWLNLSHYYCFSDSPSFCCHFLPPKKGLINPICWGPKMQFWKMNELELCTIRPQSIQDSIMKILVFSPSSLKRICKEG